MATKTNTFNVIFHLRKIAATHGKLPVYARITIHSKRIELAVKQLIDPVNWNESRGMAKGTKEYFGTVTQTGVQQRAITISVANEPEAKKEEIKRIAFITIKMIRG